MRRRLGVRMVAGAAALVAVAGALTVLPATPLLGNRQAASADVAAGDLVFEQQIRGDDGYYHAYISLRHASDGSVTHIAGPSNRISGPPDVSPDGSRVVYEGTSVASGVGLIMSNIDGSGQTQLTQPPLSPHNNDFSDESPRWSPDGGKIAFTRQILDNGPSNGYNHIFTINEDGSGPQDLTPDDVNELVARLVT